MCLLLSPPHTLKSVESEPGLEPGCPLPLSEVQAYSRTMDTIWEPFAGQTCYILATYCDMTLHVSALTALHCIVR